MKKLYIFLLVLASCSKNYTEPEPYVFTRYELIKDWYTLDTVHHLKRIVAERNDSIYTDQARMTYDTIPDQWHTECESYTAEMHLEHWYYTRDGKKIQPSVYPKN